MSDNVTIPATGTGTATPVIAADDVSSVFYQRVKVDGGGDGLTVPILAGSGVAASALRVELANNGTGVLATVGAVTAISNALPAGNNNIGDVDVASIAAGDNNIGNVDIVTMPNVVIGSGTVTAVTSITNAVTVNSHAVTNAGTFATQVDGAALTSLQLIDDAIFADEAAFTVATSKVMTVGVHAVSTGAAPDSTGDATACNPVATRNRVPFVLGGDPGVLTLKHTTITTAVTDAAIVTISTGNKIVVTRLTLTLDNASTVFPTVLIGFGTANTPTTTAVLYAHGGFPAGGGMTIGDGSGIVGIGADNEDLRVTTTGNATGNGLQICVTYHLIVA